MHHRTYRHFSARYPSPSNRHFSISPANTKRSFDVDSTSFDVDSTSFDVDSTSFERYGRQMDVETTLCAYWEVGIETSDNSRNTIQSSVLTTELKNRFNSFNYFWNISLLQKYSLSKILKIVTNTSFFARNVGIFNLKSFFIYLLFIIRFYTADIKIF